MITLLMWKIFILFIALLFTFTTFMDILSRVLETLGRISDKSHWAFNFTTSYVWGMWSITAWTVFYCLNNIS